MWVMSPKRLCLELALPSPPTPPPPVRRCRLDCTPCSCQYRMSRVCLFGVRVCVRLAGWDTSFLSGASRLWVHTMDAFCVCMPCGHAVWACSEHMLWVHAVRACYERML